MSRVKIFRVIGKIVKPNLKTDFKKEVRALKAEDVKEKIFMELGSRHRARRFEIKIIKIEEISPEDAEDPLIRKLSIEEDKNVK